MPRFLTVVALALLGGTGGCTNFQFNKGSQAVDINPFAIGSGAAVISPSNSNGYVNGVPQQDWRTK